MAIEFVVDGCTDLVVDVPDEDIKYWLAAYRLIGLKAIAVRRDDLVAYVDFPSDSILATQSVVKEWGD